MDVLTGTRLCRRPPRSWASAEILSSGQPSAVLPVTLHTTMGNAVDQLPWEPGP